MKIYKYADFKSAEKILVSESVRLNPPSKFRDITDSQINISKRAQRKTIKLIQNYAIFKGLYSFMFSLDLSKKFRGKRIVNLVKREMNIYLKYLSIKKTYKPMKFLNIIYWLCKKKDPNLEVTMEEAEEAYVRNTIPNIRNLRQKARITCFSKSETNLYCWGEYADGHKGVCFEFEDGRHFFQPVVYKRKSEEMDIYRATSKVLAYSLLGIRLTYQERDFADAMLRPFYIKNNDYKPEDEVRCVLSDNESERIGYYVQDGYSYLRMNIKRVFIGCKLANSYELLDFLRLCDKKGIPVSYMSFDNKNNKVISTTLNPDN